jgi:hypothetical protein
MSGFDSDSDSDPGHRLGFPSAFDEAIQDPESVWHQNSGHFDSLGAPPPARVFNFAFFTHFSLPQVYVQRLDSWRV